MILRRTRTSYWPLASRSCSRGDSTQRGTQSSKETGKKSSDRVSRRQANAVEDFWKTVSVLHQELCSKSSEDPWEECVTVTAYVVNIEEAAAGLKNGLLSPLVQKSQIGVTSNDIFDLPAIRAVVEYKWRNWARRYLIIEFVLYLGWLISFCAFLITYIVRLVSLNRLTIKKA